MSGGSQSGGAPSASGGAPSLGGTSGGGKPSQAGASGAVAGAAGGATEPSCYSIDPSCAVSDAYVAIYDDPPVKLRYEFNSSCDQCSPSCSDCRAQPCGLWAQGVSVCGSLDLTLSACSEPNGQGVCLDTTGSEAHYTDASGKRWPMPQLLGDTNAMGSDQANGAVDLNLDLSLPNGSGGARHLPVSVHLCAWIVPSGVVCK